MASPPTPGPINAAHDLGMSLSDVLAALPDLWFVLDAQGRYLACGDDRHPWLVRPFHEVFGKPFEATLPTPVGQRGRGAIERARATGQVQRFEYELDTLDGLQQVESGRLSLQPEALHLPTLIDSCMTLLQPLAQEQAVSQERKVAEDLWVMADDRRLRQVLLNIGSNAIKYNRRAGRVRWAAALMDAPADTTSSSTSSTRRVCLSVQDDGPGLSEDQQHRLFQPFERLGHETSGVVGSGLGLLIARRMVQEMGGDLSLQSTPGQGTRVTVQLPVGAPTGPAAAAGSAPAPAPTRAAAPPASAPLRVLYVEDNPVNALILQEAVAGLSHIDLRVAPDGPQALHMARQYTPHVLVLDAHLPGMSGHEMLQQLRILPGLAEAPAIMCSADAMNEDLARARASGFLQYWTKPLELAQVLDDLDNLYQRCAVTAPADAPSTPAPASLRTAPHRS